MPGSEMAYRDSRGGCNGPEDGGRKKGIEFRPGQQAWPSPVIKKTVPEYPKVCIVDEDPRVQAGWKSILGPKVRSFFFNSPDQLLDFNDRQHFFLDSLACLVISRLFEKKTLDIVCSDIPYKIRLKTNAPLFLNWQGYIGREELEKNFDGKVYQKYGVRWVTLKQRIARIKKSRQPAEKGQPGRSEGNPPLSSPPPSPASPEPSRESLCLDLLRQMAANASGEHRLRIESYIARDLKTGIMFLEAIYNRLLVSRDIPPTCPSRYLNSSPVIATRALEKALYQ